MLNRKQIRLKGYDYSYPGWYFITINTKWRAHFFGEIIDGQMILNDAGNIADIFWIKIRKIHRNIDLDEFIVMPDHIHGIVIIKNSVRDAKFASPTDRTKMELSKIIQQYKRAVTLQIKSTTTKTHFKWQRSFYDKIIRNEKELYNIRKYIKQNPKNWGLNKKV